MRHTCRPRADAGFTLVEIAIALALLVLAATGVMQMTGLAVRMLRDARAQTSATLLASQKLEQLRALRWTVDAGGLPQDDRTSNVAFDPPRGGGTGLSASPAGALDAAAAGCVDYLDARGTWLGTGDAPPPDAQFVRRWSITPRPEDPGDTLVVAVLVTTVERDRQARRPRERLAGDALVTTLFTRREP